MKTSKKQKSILCALAVSALLSQSSSIIYAAEQEEFGLDQVVVTANRVPTKVSETAANVTVITGEQIEKGHYQNLGAVLRNVNGVIVTSSGFAGSKQMLLINGDDRIIVMIDGRKIGRPDGELGNGNFDLANMTSLKNIERIEVVKGGASALYGSDAVGGVINIITKKGMENQTQLNTSIGSWGQKEYGLVMQGKEDKLSWYVTADQKKQDHVEYKSLAGTDKGEVKKWPNSYFNGKGLTVRLDNKIDENRSLTFNFEHWNNESGQPYDLSFKGNDISMSLWNNWALAYNFKQKAEVPGNLRIYSNYFHQHFSGDNYTRTTGVQYQNGWKLNNKNTLIAGTEWEQGEVIKTTKFDGSINFEDKSITTTAVYIQDIYKMTDKWTLTPGIRYDHNSKFGGQTTPKINVNYSADKDTDIYASYNKVFKAPNLNDLYKNDGGSWNGIPWGTYGDPNLKPERGHVATLGINKKLNKNTNINANYFESEITDAIDWPETSAYSGMYMAKNINSEKKHGFELNVKHNFSPKYYAQVGYSYLHSEIDKGAGYQVRDNNRQPNGYRVNLGYTDAQWNIGIDGISAAGRNSIQFIDSSYWVWNMNVNYKINNNANAYLKANNITNEAYQVIASAKGDYPMPARNFQFGVQYKM